MTNNAYVILIIDDSASDRRIYRRYLEEEKKYQIEEAETAKAGLGAISRIKPDCVLLDFRLPDATGTEILDDIASLTSAPVIMISGNPEASTPTQGYRKGVVRYLSKDLLDAKSLRSAISAAIKDYIG